MNIAVRYYSRSGNTKALAEAIAQSAGVEAVSCGDADSLLNNPTDLLFIGGGLYAYGLDRNLKKWIEALDGKNVKKAVVFSTSRISKHALDLLRNSLEEKGIDVSESTIYAKNHPNESEIENAKSITKKVVKGE